MATATESRLQAKTLSTSLTVNDVQQSIRFFEGLGFTIDEKWEEGGKLLGVMMRAGKQQLGLTQDDWKKGRDRKKGLGMRIFIESTQNIDEIAARAKAAGIKLESEPHEAEWKSRVFEVTDPTGFLLTVGSAIA